MNLHEIEIEIDLMFTTFTRFDQTMMHHSLVEQRPSGSKRALRAYDVGFCFYKENETHDVTIVSCLVASDHVDALFIEDIFLLESYQDHSIRLLEACIEYARQKHKKRVIVHAKEGSDKKEFYQFLGFVPCRESTSELHIHIIE